jgi:hypothetical protein
MHILLKQIKEFSMWGNMEAAMYLVDLAGPDAFSRGHDHSALVMNSSPQFTLRGPA